MPMVVRAFPLKADPQELETLTQALRDERRNEADEFFRQYGVRHESWHMQETPAGPWVIAVTVLDDPTEAGQRYAKSSEAFEAWFKGEVRKLSGVELNDQPLRPPTTTVYEWAHESRPQVFCAR